VLSCAAQRAPSQTRRYRHVRRKPPSLVRILVKEIALPLDQLPQIKTRTPPDDAREGLFHGTSFLLDVAALALAACGNVGVEVARAGRDAFGARVAPAAEVGQRIVPETGELVDGKLVKDFFGALESYPWAGVSASSER
jgi:hypothetical protein